MDVNAVMSIDFSLFSRSKKKYTHLFLCTQYIVQHFSITATQTVALCEICLHSTIHRLETPSVPTVSCGLRFRVYRVSQEECARLREGVPYVKVQGEA